MIEEMRYLDHYIIGVIYDHEKSEKINFRKIQNFLMKMFLLGKNPGWGSGHGKYPLGHGHITKNGYISFFT